MPKTLLLADDSVTIQKVVGISFANEDVTLITVDNGDDAIARARETRPDAVLADVVMPGKSGYDVCQAIRNDPALRDTPVLLLTGTFEAFDEERARQVGAAGHIAKPFEAQTLVERVSRLLAERPATPAPAAAPTPAPAAAAPPRAEAEAFDFFEDELGDLPAVRPGLRDAEVEPLELTPGDEPDALSFDDEIESLDPEPTPLTAPLELGDEPDWQAPERPGAAASLDQALFDDEPSPDEPPLAMELIEPEEPISARPVGTVEAERTQMIGQAAQVFDLELDGADASGEARLPVDADDLAQATLLDPDGASGFDVSASDLGDSFGASPDAPGAGLFEALEDPPRAPAPPLPAAPEPAHETRVDWEAKPASAAAPRAAGGVAPAPLDALAPVVREQIHDLLEKIAWEAFGNAAEEIVRQAVERMETVAWEVVPQLAETLIREEIRKLKGDEPED